MKNRHIGDNVNVSGFLLINKNTFFMTGKVVGRCLLHAFDLVDNDLNSLTMAIPLFYLYLFVRIPNKKKKKNSTSKLKYAGYTNNSHAFIINLSICIYLYNNTMHSLIISCVFCSSSSSKQKNENEIIMNSYFPINFNIYFIFCHFLSCFLIL